MSQYWQASNNDGLRLGRGLLVSVEDDEIELPFRFNVSYSPMTDGRPNVQPLFDYVSNVKVMSRRLVEVLRSAGVDNLQVFPAVVTDVVSGRTSEDHVVVNVVGVVACADMAKSTSTPIGAVYYFNKLVIDPRSARDLLLFRLKQSPIEIIVHERVADAIRRGGFTGVVLEPAAETPPTN